MILIKLNEAKQLFQYWIKLSLKLQQSLILQNHTKQYNAPLYQLEYPRLPHQRNDFLNLFLKEIKVPKKYTECLWKVYREYVFEEGRIDFVIETEKFLIVIEMKIDAEDGYRQLERYDKFCKKKGKDYLIYYLTLNGSMPEKQSIGRMNSEKLCSISFEKHILNWLQACMYIVDNSSYSYSFVKQYDASVRHMLELENEVMKVKDLITKTSHT